MPRGIDRIDLALARHFFCSDTSQTAYGILPTPWGIRAYPASRVRRGLRRLEAFWAEEIDTDRDAVWTHLRQRMQARIASEAPPSLVSRRGALSLRQKIIRMGQLLAATGIGLGRSARSFLPRGTVYLNVGQIGLAMPMFFRWLEERPDIASLIMLHDVIPIQYPEMVDPASVRHHARMVRTAARVADGLIVSTSDAAAGIASELAKCGCNHVPTLVRGLPLSKGFTRGIDAHPDLADADYFVVCGTIEPRKNHALLIDVWQKLIERDGMAAPHLVMVGTPGWSAGNLFALLDRSPLLRSRVHHAAGLSTPALAQLIAGARGLLVPSLAEGFSLPPLEARALGVPVIASDIAVHRERADAGMRLLGTDDVAGWLAAVDATPREALRSALPIAPSWGERAYCEDILRFAKVGREAKLASSLPPDAPLHDDPASMRGALFGEDDEALCARPEGSRETVKCE